ncbi:MAG: translation initiation factor [Muribaculaceae bacterium]|nr:translation initiation factor [Muribaculaceae bacterium]
MEDWKSALASLASSLPEENENSANPKDIEEPSPSEPSDKQSSILHVILSKKHRGGKTATIVEGFTIPQSELDDIARRLKQKLGVGGSTREGEILIQGDHRAAVTDFLKSLNFKVR